MMIKKTLLFIILLGCFFLFSYYLKPVVVVYNNTGNIIHLFKSTGVRNVEPEAEEAIASMKPIVIKNGEYKKILLSWESVKLENGQLYLGWNTVASTGSVAEINSGSVFDITKNAGYCSYDVIIGDGRHDVKHVDKIFCIGKLRLAVN